LWTHVLFFGAESPNYISNKHAPRALNFAVSALHSETLADPLSQVHLLKLFDGIRFLWLFVGPHDSDAWMSQAQCAA
jgi:hypothetical protein